MQFVTLNGHTLNLAQVCGIEWHDNGTATVGFSSGGCKQYACEDAKLLAAAIGKTNQNGLKELPKSTVKESPSPVSSKVV